MKIIMLSGKASCGKTTTLNMIYDFINPPEEDIVESKKKAGNDFECIIIFNNKRIAFFTMGDFSCHLLEAFEKYNTKCDYLICACNTRFIKPYKKIKNYEHVIIDKSIASSQIEHDIVNNSDKEKIIKIISS